MGISLARSGCGAASECRRLYLIGYHSGPMLPLKAPPPPSLTLVGRPQDDRDYVHFEHAAEAPFDARAIDFSLRNAWWLAEAALLTYWSPERARILFHDTAALESEFISEGGTD